MAAPRFDIAYAQGDLGVFRSTNGGATWTKLEIHGLGRLFSIVVDPTNPSIVYGTPGSGGFYKSLDGGRGWTRLTLPSECQAGFAISPAQPAVIYMGGTNICRSDDGGSTWRTRFTASGTMMRLIPLAADPRNAATVYGVATDRLYRTSIYKTVDGGSTWSPIGALPRLSTSTASEQAPTKLLIDRADPKIIYTTVTGGVVRSRDGGATWSSISDGLPASRTSPSFVLPTTYDIAQDATRPQILYAAATDDGLYGSDDRGAHWQRVNATLPGVRVVAANSGRVLMGNVTGSDGFLIAFDSYGAVLTSTYIGGSGNDGVSGIKVIDRDAVVLGGTTSSSYWPLAGGAVREYRGGADAFWMQIVRSSSR